MDVNEKGSGAPAAGSALHTPGPWTLVGTEIRKDGYVVTDTWDMSPADARLIVAAPALADALDETLLYLDPTRGSMTGRELREHILVILRAAGRLPR